MKNFILRVAALIFSLAIVAPACSDESFDLPRLEPSSDIPSDEQLKVFLQQLGTAVQQRDKDALQKLMAPDIKLTFGPPSEASPEDFLGLANPDSPVWAELQEMLKLGGAYPTSSRNDYCIPYTYTAFPDYLDAYNHQVVVKPASAYSDPNDKSSKMTELELVIVRTDFGQPQTLTAEDGTEWTKIYLNEKTAYIPSGNLRSPIGYRACFGKRNGQWKITHLLAGD